jgi:lipoate-protein ligase B
VITVGRGAREVRNLREPGSTPVYEVERGGGVTYHGPGQLVGYPIFLLGEHERDLHRLLRDIEQALIDAVARFGVDAGRRPGLTGIWVGERKLASIGVAVRRWVTWHGFALNVTTDLARFEAIRPCGLSPEVMTSMQALLGRAPARADLATEVVGAFARVFSRDFR